MITVSNCRGVLIVSKAYAGSTSSSGGLNDSLYVCLVSKLSATVFVYTVQTLTIGLPDKNKCWQNLIVSTSQLS